MRRLIDPGFILEYDIGYPRAAVEQVEQCLRNMGQGLEEAGALLADVVRVRHILPDPGDFTSISEDPLPFPNVRLPRASEPAH